MTKRIAINGFGRIGRCAYRIIHERQQAGKTDLEVVAVNDLTDPESLAHLLRYDSVHGRFGAEVQIKEGSFVVDGKSVRVTAEKDPKRLPHKELEVDVVFESTGLFTGKDTAGVHLEAGAKKVVFSAPYKGVPPDATICYGINNEAFKPDMTVISTASCTTNCLVPVAKVIHENWGIESALVTTVHSYTNDQRILDLAHKDKRRARAAALNMIPTSTGAAKAVELVLPELKGRFDGMSIRVPTPNVSIIDLVCNVAKDTTKADVNAALKKAAEGPLKGIMGYTDDELVSSDFMGTSESSYIDADSTKVIGKRMVKVLSWYDNEWGFTNRAVDLLEMVAKAC